jgi:hypothetical protein
LSSRRFLLFFTDTQPFFSKGRIQSIEASPSVGTASVSGDEKRIIWSIGQKFPTKNFEVWEFIIVPLDSLARLQCLRPCSSAKIRSLRFVEADVLVRSTMHISIKETLVSSNSGFLKEKKRISARDSLRLSRTCAVHHLILCRLTTAF